MESSSNFHHQLQEQFLDHQNPISLYGVGHGNNNPSSAAAWNPNHLILNGGNFNLTNSSRDGENIDHILVPPPSLNTASMFQDLGFHSNSTSFTNTQSAAHELHLAKIKKELSSHHPFKNQEQQFHYIKQQQQQHHHDHDQLLLQQQQDLSHDHEQQKLLLKSYSSGDLYSNNHNTYSSQIFPSTNISNLIMNPSSSSSSTSFSSSLGMNFQALDLLSSGSFGSSSQPSQNTNNNNNNNLGLSFDLDHLQGISSSSSSTLWPSNNNNKMSSLFMNGGRGGTETKRSSNALEEYSSTTSSKATSPHHTTVVVPKKPRMESRSSSFPPFKVRKEKLGDRIATLQQLVAPFGKTDTASVLMEAIGYIKFLQDQVETLSVPYMKSVRNHSRMIVQRSQGTSSTEDVQEGNKDGKLQRDLRSRGLCLVPLTFTSYISGVDNISVGPVWPPLPNFGGGGT